MKKALLLLIILLFAAIVWRVEYRSFYYLKNGKCVTVWKAYDGLCYIIPRKYNGVLKPSAESYLVTPYTKGLDIIWQENSNNIIANLEDEKNQIIHNCPSGIQIANYNLNKRYNDSLYLYFDGEYYRYKKNVDYLTLNIKEEYAYDKKGKRQD
ncbi:hypothetical protein A0256_23670 [Mucilaginibacter sp. PAMC 26640]|nr:hypothetical protein A0256_23670 [Mucilaginibacter sp. PAMC 26640]